MNARDRKTLRRLMNYYGHRAIIDEMADAFDARAAERKAANDIVGQRWSERAAKVYRHVELTLGINGREESQPEYDNLLPRFLS